MNEVKVHQYRLLMGVFNKINQKRSVDLLKIWVHTISKHLKSLINQLIEKSIDNRSKKPNSHTAIFFSFAKKQDVGQVNPFVHMKNNLNLDIFSFLFAYFHFSELMRNK